MRSALCTLQRPLKSVFMAENSSARVKKLFFSSLNCLCGGGKIIFVIFHIYESAKPIFIHKTARGEVERAKAVKRKEFSMPLRIIDPTASAQKKAKRTLPPSVESLDSVFSSCSGSFPKATRKRKTFRWAVSRVDRESRKAQTITAKSAASVCSSSRSSCWR